MLAHLDGSDHAEDVERGVDADVDAGLGAIELRGRLRPSTRLATGRPWRSGRKEKSVNSLLSKKPPAIRRLPNPDSIVVVIETALP